MYVQVISSVTSSVQSSAPYAYDAVLSLALAINQTLEELDTYSIQLLRERLLTNLNQLNTFQGLSVSMHAHACTHVA